MRPFGNEILIYRKIPKNNKPFQIQAPQTRNTKNPPFNHASKKMTPAGGLYFEIALKYKVKQSKNGKYFLSTIRLQ